MLWSYSKNKQQSLAYKIIKSDILEEKKKGRRRKESWREEIQQEIRARDLEADLWKKAENIGDWASENG